MANQYRQYIGMVTIYKVIGEPEGIGAGSGIAPITLATFGKKEDAESFLATAPADRQLERFLLSCQIDTLRVQTTEFPVYA